jgi:hypothetical protein
VGGGRFGSRSAPALPPVVEELDLRLIHQPGVVTAYVEIKSQRAADHPFQRGAVDGTGERPHEITITARGDISIEAICPK